ncbi:MULTISPECIES: hypothetical protein [Nocardiopsis]|uniref:Uncharacterized protein n=1 Tax=Nocardiopsis sinuspersici TaxID=501010 RepID=A0A1V3C434_9ACTN|nr:MULTISPECIES: hypothetical protein [Nocardiopsis]OOC55554.1 hypothetical protein NOSIN_18430 [Nocardiopsis sinuspersici]
MGIDPRIGVERWSYLVSGAEVAVGFPSGAESVLVMYGEKGLFRDRVSEVVLDPETGEIEHSSTFTAPEAPGGIQEMAELGFTDTRIVVEDQVVGYQRGEEEEELWHVDPGEYCGGEELSPEDFDVASDSEHVYLSVLCAEESKAHLVALSPSQGDAAWQQSFGAGERESPPQISVVGHGPSYGAEVHPVARALNGDLGSDYLYVNSGNGKVHNPDLFDLESMNMRFPEPAGDQERAPAAILVGSPDRVEMMVTYLAADMLEEQGIVSVEEFHEDLLVREDDGSVRLTDDPAVLSSRNVRNLLLEALAQIGS